MMYVSGGIAREAVGNRYLDGRVDEVRFHSTGRSAAWVRAGKKINQTQVLYLVNGSAPEPEAPSGPLVIQSPSMVRCIRLTELRRSLLVRR